MIPQANTIPSYSELLQEAGKQLRSRKGILFWRTLLLVLPGFAMVTLFLWGDTFYKGLDYNEWPSFYYNLGLFILFFGSAYYLVLSFIFGIEKRIWLDSFFDQRNLTAKESWRIARRLFFPGFRLGLCVFLWYVLFPVVVWLIVTGGHLYILGYIANISENLVPIFLFTFYSVWWIVVPIVYVYFVQLRVRFLWFVFLDTYNPLSFSVREVFKEAKKLNAVSKGEAFRKALVAHLGSDSLHFITREMVRSLQAGFGLLGHTGRVFGAFFRVFGEEYGKQAVHLGKIAALYILYRHARELLHGASQEVNENIYILARKETGLKEGTGN